ncbi:MAG: nitroreductase family protein [Spirochaetales bacterium]|nr:nitroreductase family protein [Spirochaetales bacterium]
MDFFDVVKARYSYRGEFLDKPVPREDLIKIVQAGLDAPSGRNFQTTEFIVVDDPKVIKKIQALPDGNKALCGGKAYILCLIPKEQDGTGETEFLLEDCSAAVENMLLAATALGYGSVWIDGWLRSQNRGETLAQIAGVAADKKVQIILPLGVPAEETERKAKKSLEERVKFL